jgi:predicted phosphodiesterase
MKDLKLLKSISKLSMNKKQKLDLVLELVQEGLGRRKIAKILETTEWEARHLMAEVLGPDNDLNLTKKKAEPVPIEAKRSKPFTKVTSTVQGKTTVKVVGEPIKADTPSNITVRPVNMKVAILSDIHYPYEDANAIQLTKAFLHDYEPDMIVLNGDVSDCWSISRYEKNPKGRPDIQQELDYTHDRLAEWVNEFPDTEFKFLEGNHEARMRKHVQANAPALMALKGLSYPTLVKLDQLGIEWIPENKDLQIGKLMIHHGTRARKHAGTSARAHFEDFGCSLIIGHIHRLSVAWKRNKYGDHAMIENGTLCELDVEYARFPDWQLGFSCIDFDGEDFSVFQCPISDYKLIAGGKVYVL